MRNLAKSFRPTAVAVLILLAGVLASLSVGMSEITFGTVLKSIFTHGETREELIVRTLRMPRTITAVLVGAGLAVAGALMQALTKNPLASPQIFGINAGASLFVVGSAVFFPGLGPQAVVYFAFAGAAAGGLAVYTAGASTGNTTPVRLALAGVSVHLLFTSMTESLILFHEHTTEDVLYWLTGAVDGKTWDHVLTLFPWFAVGMAAALLLARSVTLLELDDQVTVGLGQRTTLVRIGVGLTVIVLAGACVAVAGPIGFVGLVVPHIVRFFAGTDYRLILPLCALFGGVLMVYADLAARFVAWPFESPVGIVTALIGAPFFIYLANKRRSSE